ncbi:FAD-dependent oxidoreductase [Streptomyces sp. NPDC059994]|uniref:FAD-dependent oxidoreductase n=1 Tax=Streptomyces sp. NPDC059994 TaxID=3347029 RepID=UPI00369CA016
MQRAIVLGGSFAGLLAARALSDHAREVVVLEPDDLSQPGTGPGAPQRDQLHALLSMGHTHLERWFPGITQQLVDSGAHHGTKDAIQFYVDGTRRHPVDVPMLSATRPLIEGHIRRRVLALPNVQLLHARATHLLSTATRITGVGYSETEQTGSAADAGSRRKLDADLVVDAMGRSSRLSTWLTNSGWDELPTDRMRIDLGYATALFHRGDELPGTVIAHATPGPASGYQTSVSEPGALAAVEGNRWMVVLAGYTDYRPGRDPDEFRKRMLRCVAPLQTVAEKCAMAEDIKTFHFASSQRRDFTRLSRFPGGLMAIGDSVASVNPIYGQGLTLAVLQVNALAIHLQSGAPAHAPALGYFRQTGAIVNAVWQLSTTADLAQPHVTGPYPRGYRLIRRIGDKITSASLIDPTVNQAYMDVVHMRAHPRTLIQPGILLTATRVTASR